MRRVALIGHAFGRIFGRRSAAIVVCLGAARVLGSVERIALEAWCSSAATTAPARPDPPRARKLVGQDCVAVLHPEAILASRSLLETQSYSRAVLATCAVAVQSCARSSDVGVSIPLSKGQARPASPGNPRPCPSDDVSAALASMRGATPMFGLHQTRLDRSGQDPANTAVWTSWQEMRARSVTARNGPDPFPHLQQQVRESQRHPRRSFRTSIPGGMRHQVLTG